MRKLILVVLLASCATEPKQPTEAQLAVISYYASQCEKRGIDPNNEQALRGCIWTSYQRDVQAGVFGRQTTTGDIVQGMGSVYGSGAQTQCTTRPDYAGGWITTCR